jgi:integrase
LDLAKAMLRTGYYAPDHPQAQQSLTGLYAEFGRVLEDRPGITYLVGLDRDRRTIMIDGYDVGPLVLDKVMISGMAELFTPRIKDALKEHSAQYRFAAYDGQRPEYVFHHTRSRRHYKAGARVHSFRRAVANAAERAKLPAEWRFHDLRHRRATTWLAEGRSPVLVKEALGHADLRTTMSYTHLVKEHLRALVEPAPQGISQGISRA